MSDHLDAAPACNLRDIKEKGVDINVSMESLRVYDNPWVEPVPVYPPRPAEPRLQVVIQHSEKRNHVRADSVILGLLCFFLLTGIICLAVIVRKDQSNLADLRTKNGRLTVNVTQLTKDRYALWETFCEGKKKRKCENLDLGKIEKPS